MVYANRNTYYKHVTNMPKCHTTTTFIFCLKFFRKSKKRIIEGKKNERNIKTFTCACTNKCTYSYILIQTYVYIEISHYWIWKKVFSLEQTYIFLMLDDENYCRKKKNKLRRWHWKKIIWEVEWPDYRNTHVSHTTRKRIEIEQE